MRPVELEYDLSERIAQAQPGRACSAAWGKDWGSNQIAGMSICEAAAQRSFEHYREPPWN